MMQLLDYLWVGPRLLERHRRRIASTQVRRRQGRLVLFVVRDQGASFAKHESFDSLIAILEERAFKELLLGLGRL